MTRFDYIGAVQDAAPPSLSPARLARALRAGGAGVLSDADLLSLVLGPGRGTPAGFAARELLRDPGWSALLGTSAGASWWRTLGPARAARLAAALELARRLAGRDAAAGPVLRTPREVSDAVADLRAERREHFVGLYLNTRNRLLVRETISVGSLNASIVHPREVFEPALRHRAASLIVVHNHPSGETDPSDDDLGITRRLAEAGDLLGIGLLDHVIVGGDRYTSLKEEGHL